ncbi:hypothetical protein J4Q44_G00026700 [Coregonus suidteri]|uniref:Uncharacterized protein n=2 Tax=Coregonus TaxID=27772 RepID=A0AAN8MMH9_9TELE
MGQHERCFEVKLQVKEQEEETSTTTEPANRAITASQSPERVVTAAVGTIVASSMCVIFIMALTLGVIIYLRRRRHSDEDHWHTYEDVQDSAMFPNVLYSLQEFDQKEDLCTFQCQ